MSDSPDAPSTEPTESDEVTSDAAPNEDGCLPSSRSIWSGRLLVGWALLLCLVFTIVPLSHFSALKGFQIEWGLWMGISELLGSALILLLLRFPAVAMRKHAAIVHLLVPLIAVLNWLHLLELVFIRGLQLLLRAAILGGWSFVAIGVPLILAWLVRREKPDEDRRRKPLRWVKPWVSVTLCLVLLEPFMGFVERQGQQLALPQSCPPSADHFHVVALGASTMLGHPYQPRYGIPKVLEFQLRAGYEPSPVVENLAVGGINFKMAVRLCTLN